MDKGDERKKEYIKIFPTDKKYMKNESVELSSFAKNLSIIKETNMEYFINYCIQNSYWLFDEMETDDISFKNIFIFFCL